MLTINKNIMKAFFKILIVIILSFGCTKVYTSEETYNSTVSYGTVLMIYGGKDNDEYLGKLNASKYDSESIWNQYGEYGSRYNSKSIWNGYGTYGSKYSSYSPFNNYASNPPVLVDKNGKFYGYSIIYYGKAFTESQGLLRMNSPLAFGYCVLIGWCHRSVVWDTARECFLRQG